MKTDVLVIGGGFAGAITAQKLADEGISNILVDKKDYFEVTFAVLRDVAAPEKTKGKARQYYKELLEGTFVQSSVKELTKTTALLENGESITFKSVVIASGTAYPSLPIAKSTEAISLTTRHSELLRYHQKLQSSNEVLIIGGGVVGVELAGEIAFALPHANVTLAHNSNTLLDSFKKKAQRKALKQLTDLGVNVEFNTLYEETEGAYRDKNSGKSIAPDIALVAIGTQPNNDFLRPHFSHLLNEKGFINVTPYLEVIGQDNFYALGDIADAGEAKLGYLAMEQGKYLGEMLARKLSKKTLKPYKRHPFMALVPTGQKTGVVQLMGFVSTWKWLVNMKQKDLFISKIYSALRR